MLRAYLEKRRVRRIFRKVVNPETADAILDGHNVRQPPTESQIELILVFVRGDKPEQISHLIDRVIEICAVHQAYVDGLVASIVVAGFGTHPTSKPAVGARVGFVADLLRQMGPNIKVVHGAGAGYYGLFGADKHLRYSFVFPEFDGVLGLLGETEFGTAQEFKPSLPQSNG
ncbi:MAG TPA: hypothetical protein VFC44_07305 [Candidatus Saccharimonadales bacterium]|nr:hypothetical protein [Candidatus Saccharimonadales bacterium]